MIRRVESVACRSIPNPKGDGATGCGHGWTQTAGQRHTCPRCGRALVVTGRWTEQALR